MPLRGPREPAHPNLDVDDDDQTARVPGAVVQELLQTLMETDDDVTAETPRPAHTVRPVVPATFDDQTQKMSAVARAAPARPDLPVASPAAAGECVFAEGVDVVFDDLTELGAPSQTGVRAASGVDPALSDDTTDEWIAKRLTDCLK